MEQSELHPELSEGVVGKIAYTNYQHGYGFIDASDGRRAFFHVTNLVDPTSLPPVGTAVQCNLVTTEKGLQARDVTEVAGLAGEASADSAQEWISPRDLLAQAVLARDSREYSTARRLYKRGLLESPSIQLVLSYAAMEKNQRRLEQAMKVYEQEIGRAHV